MNQSIKMYINLNSFSESPPETGGKIHTFKLGKKNNENQLSHSIHIQILWNHLQPVFSC